LKEDAGVGVLREVLGDLEKQSLEFTPRKRKRLSDSIRSVISKFGICIYSFFLHAKSRRRSERGGDHLPARPAPAYRLSRDDYDEHNAVVNRGIDADLKRSAEARRHWLKLIDTIVNQETIS